MNDTRKSDGTVTAYGFACGYIQRHGQVTLEKGIRDYWVRYPNTQGDYEWEHYQYLADARKSYNKLKKEIAL